MFQESLSVIEEVALASLRLCMGHYALGKFLCEDFYILSAMELNFKRYLMLMLDEMLFLVTKLPEQ